MKLRSASNSNSRSASPALARVLLGAAHISITKSSGDRFVQELSSHELAIALLVYGGVFNSGDACSI
jgi:hypothetical protein